MRFMYIVTSPQPNRYPTPELMEAIHKLADREIKAGRMIDSGRGIFLRAEAIIKPVIPGCATPPVVPAHAATHTPSSRLESVVDAFYYQLSPGVLGPRAGTTRCDSAFSRHDFVRGLKLRSPDKNKGRREDRVRAAPAVSCALML